MLKNQYLNHDDEWIRQIPKNWKVARLKFAAKINPSKSKTIHLPDEMQVSFLPMELIVEDGQLKLNEIRKLGEVKNGFTYFEDGDILGS